VDIQIYHVIVEGMHHELMEILSWSAQLFIVLITIIAALVARWQLREMGEYRQQRLLIANAQLLMELDGRRDSEDMRDSRRIFTTTRDAINAKIGAENPRANDDEKKRLVAQAWMDSLHEKRTNDQREYATLMLMCGFFETVGLMVDRHYVSPGDVLELFLGPIAAIEMCFGGHIRSLERETGVLAGLYKHARNLSQRAATYT
jgi:hypothetical protein